MASVLQSNGEDGFVFRRFDVWIALYVYERTDTIALKKKGAVVCENQPSLFAVGEKLLVF